MKVSSTLPLQTDLLPHLEERRARREYICIYIFVQMKKKRFICMETPLLSRADLLKFCTGRALTHSLSLSLTLEQRDVGGDFDRAACGVDQEFFNHSPAGLQFLHAGGRTSQFPLPCF
jgi:hypothetical protein